VASLVGSALIAVWTAITLLLIRDSGTTDLVTGNLSGIDTARPMGVLGVLLLVWFAGAAGSVIDSVLGATVQAQYRTRDGDYTERRSLLPANDASDAIDRQVNAKVRGVHWVTNDVVNLVSALGAASLAVGIGIVLS
jgi:uncharacterized membrane protein